MSLGIMQMLNILFPDTATHEAFQRSVGKTIESVKIEDNELRFLFADGATLTVWDDGQNCCEERYMATADDLREFAGAKLLDAAIKDGETKHMDWGYHELRFLDIQTDKGVFQVANHNEHNGYYGGFSIKARATP